METSKLTHLNSSLRVEGSEKRRSLEIKQVQVLQPPQADHAVKLKLQVLDEKDVTIYSQPLVPGGPHADTAVHIDQKFVFYDHLTVRVTADPEESAFEIEVSFS
jgi:hypothetical protein